MTTKTIDKYTKSERSAASPRARSNGARAASLTKDRKQEVLLEQESGQASPTKHAQLLQLLSRQGNRRIGGCSSCGGGGVGHFGPNSDLTLV